MKTTFEEFDPTKVDQGGMPAPGKCQLLVTDVEEHDGYFSVTHEILAHEVPGQVGKTTYTNINVTGKAAKRAFLFAYATKVASKEEVAQATATGSDMEISYEEAVGRVYYATLESSDYHGKIRVRVEWDFKAIDDPGITGYPFNPEFTPENYRPTSVAKDESASTSKDGKIKPAVNKDANRDAAKAAARAAAAAAVAKGKIPW